MSWVLSLNEGSVAVLEDRTEGWIAGLQMAPRMAALQSHLSMHHREDVPEFIEGFSGTNRYILDYFWKRFWPISRLKSSIFSYTPPF